MPGTIFLLVALPAIGGRPLTTEDASILREKACQVEAWVDRSREATTAWFVPACNFGAHIEWQAGAARTREAGRSFLDEQYVQAKTAFGDLEKSPWAVGAVVGVTRKPARETRRGWEDPFATIPISFTPDAGHTLVHFSPGWRHDRHEGRHITTWGVAIERKANERLTILGEAFGENAERPFLRIGGRAVAIKDRLEFDLTWVTRPGGARADRYISLGLYWQSR